MPDLLSLCVVVILLGLFFLTVAGYIFYLGLQINVKVHTGVPPIKKITFAYKFKEGPYKNCGQLFKEAHFIGPELSCIGVFYDHPKKVLGPLCRYAIGSILTDGENKADEELLKRYKTSGFNVFTFPQVTHVVTTSFPHGTFFLNYLRMRRVYQQLEHYIQWLATSQTFWHLEIWFEHGTRACKRELELEREDNIDDIHRDLKERRLCAHPYLEIHRDGQIQFMVPLARQGDFYVPEVRQVERRLSEQEESFSDTDISGADSNSEYSSGSGVLLSDSRETSPAGSSVHSVPIRDQGSRDFKGRSSSGTPFKELDVVQSGAHQEEREKQSHGDSKQKNLEVPTQGLWGIVGGEE